MAQSGFVKDQSTATEDALRRAVDTTTAFIHTAQPDGYLDYFNRGWLDFLGKSLEDVCGWRWNARRTVRSDYPDSDPQDHKSFPVLIMGTDNWHEILRFIEQMAKAGMIAPSDMQVVHATNSVNDAIAHIRSHAIERFGLHVSRRVRRHSHWLGERGLPPLGRRTEDLRSGKAILNVAGSGKFSSDRTIAEYATDIWSAKACPVS